MTTESQPHVRDAFAAFVDENPEAFNNPVIPHKKEAPPRRQADEEEDVEAPEEDLLPEDEDQVETDSEDADSDESEDSNDDEESEFADEEYVTVKVNGKTYEIPKSLEAGIMKDEDYSRKTMALSEEKKLLDRHLNEVTAERQAVLNERAAYKQILEGYANQIVQAKANQPDWDALLKEDPVEFQRLRWEYDKLAQHEQELVKEYQGIRAKEQREYAVRLQNEQQAGLAKLQDWEPSWKGNPSKLASDMRKAADYGIAKLGATEADFAQANDARVLYAFWQAYQFSQLQKESSQVRSKAVKTKSLPAGTSGRDSNDKGSFKKDLQRLQQSGGRDREAARRAFLKFV